MGPGPGGATVVRRPEVGPPCLGRVSGANRAGAPRLCQAAGQSSPADSEWGLQVKPGRLGMGQSSPADSECQWGGGAAPPGLFDH